jgi:predicted ArsR family transcriptional regulator
VPEPSPIEVHKALAEGTRYRLYRYLRLSGRAVSVRELSTRLSLHVNTLRPHLRRLEDAGLITSEVRRGSPSVGRPQTLYSVVERDEREGRDYRLLAEILVGQLTGARQRERAVATAREWGAYLLARSAPRPGARTSSGPNLAVLQEALAEARFEPRFRRRGTTKVDIALRDCPFRDLLDEHRDLVCAIHRGLLEGMLAGSRPPLRLEAFEPLADRSTVCRLTAAVQARSV